MNLHFVGTEKSIRSVWIKKVAILLVLILEIMYLHNNGLIDFM